MADRATQIINFYETTLASLLPAGSTNATLTDTPGINATLSNEDTWFYLVVDPDSSGSREVIVVKASSGTSLTTIERDLETGDISVTYESPNNMGEDAVYLQYKAPQKLEEGRTVPADFEATELEPRGIRMGPDDYDIEFDGENVVNSVDELMSDTSTLKQFATNKKPTMKEFVESKNKKDRVQSINKDQVEQAEYLETKYGPGTEEGSPYFQNFDRSEDFASGGIAGMLGE